MSRPAAGFARFYRLREIAERGGSGRKKRQDHRQSFMVQILRPQNREKNQDFKLIDSQKMTKSLFKVIWDKWRSNK